MLRSTPSVVALGPLVPSPTTFTLRDNVCVLIFLLALPIRRQPPPQHSLPSTPHSPSRFKGHHQTGARRVQKVQLRRPTTPFLPPFYFFEIFASSSGYPYHQILSLDSLHPYSSILESLIAVLITVHVFLRSPLWSAVQLSPPTSVSLRHPPPCIMAITLTSW